MPLLQRMLAGVIGNRKFIHDFWGDAVNTASRMESHGVPSRTHLTASTRERLGAPFRFEERGLMQIKGKGELHSWFLGGRVTSTR